MIEVRVPDEQEGTKAVVRAWLKAVGDAVAENDPLVELETDKVTQEVPAPAAGVLAEIVLDTDAEAVPGALLARIETDGVTAVPRAPAKAGVQSQEDGAARDELPTGAEGEALPEDIAVIVRVRQAGSGEGQPDLSTIAEGVVGIAVSGEADQSEHVRHSDPIALEDQSLQLAVIRPAQGWQHVDIAARPEARVGGAAGVEAA